MEFPDKDQRSALGEAVHRDWDPFPRQSSVALVMGEHPVLLKACCWQGKPSACCVGRGPISLRAIPSQYFKLKSNQERTGLFFS